MKKKIFVSVMALFLSAAMLTGCGDAVQEEDRSNRSRRESSYENDKDDKNFSKKDDHDQADSTSGPEGRQNEEDTSDSSWAKPSQESDPTAPPASEEPIQTNPPAVAENDQQPANNGNETPADSAEAYTADLKQILTLAAVEDLSADDPEQMILELQALINNLDVKTAEGLVIKADLQEMVDILNDLMSIVNNMDNLEYLDIDFILNASNKIEELSESVEEHMEAFANAAEAAGIDRDTLEELVSYWGF